MLQDVVSYTSMSEEEEKKKKRKNKKKKKLSNPSEDFLFMKSAYRASPACLALPCLVWCVYFAASTRSCEGVFFFVEATGGQKQSAASGY